MAGALCSGFFFAIQGFCGACYPLVADTPCARGYLPSADTPRIFWGARVYLTRTDSPCDTKPGLHGSRPGRSS